MVGTSGSALARAPVVVAIASSLPVFTSGTTFRIGDRLKVMAPVIAPVIASGMPLNGTCVTSMPARFFSSSPARWLALPMPGVE